MESPSLWDAVYLFSPDILGTPSYCPIGTSFLLPILIGLCCVPSSGTPCSSQPFRVKCVAMNISVQIFLRTRFQHSLYATRRGFLCSYCNSISFCEDIKLSSTLAAPVYTPHQQSLCPLRIHVFTHLSLFSFFLPQKPAPTDPPTPLLLLGHSVGNCTSSNIEPCLFYSGAGRAGRQFPGSLKYTLQSFV